MVPWYLNFYVSWRDAQSSIPVHWLTYETLFRDQEKAVSEIIDFYGLEGKVGASSIKAGIDAMPKKGDRIAINRLNVGVSGRGETLLSDNQKAIEYAKNAADFIQKNNRIEVCLEKEQKIINEIIN